MSELVTDPGTGRTFYLHFPDELRPGNPLVLILNLHGGGSSGQWQNGYFPAHLLKDRYGLVIATPTAATAEPMRRWVPEADDDHLHAVVTIVLDRFGSESIAAFWLVGHSQGGLTSNRLLRTEFFADKVDGWLSLSGGRLGPVERAVNAGRPGMDRSPDAEARRRLFAAPTGLPDADFSFIYAVGEHEIASLPETSPWAERYGAGPRQRLADVIDDQPGLVYDGRLGDQSTPAWGLKPRPGTAQVYVYPDARNGRVVADVVRIDKGHTEGLEPNITERLVQLMVNVPSGKLQQAALSSS